MPGKQGPLIGAYASENGSHVVGTKDVGVLDGERPKHLEGLFGLVCEFFDAVNSFFYDVDHVHNTAATPARAGLVEPRRDFLRRRIHHGNRGSLETLRRDRTRFNARGDFLEDAKPTFLLLDVLAAKQSEEADDPLQVVGV